ncbi:MAG: grasp-with-spasm system SPASM domain peptide maturase [Bacteroidota bacterium]
MKYTQNDIFFVSSSCKLVKGAKRSVIIDYGRGEVQVIPNEYYDLVQEINRKKVSESLAAVDEDSKGSFLQFIEYMLMNEYGFFTEDITLFPEIATTFDDDQILIKDAILELDEDVFVKEDFTELLFEINEMRCNDVQLRIASDTNKAFINKVLEIVKETNILFVELYLANAGTITKDEWYEIFKDNSMLSHVHVYSAQEDKSIEFRLQTVNFHPIEIGKINYHTINFKEGCCGVISFDSLNFSDISTHHFHQKHNGCLFKKLTIDKMGNIKNCPKMTKTYGNVKEKRIKEVMQQKSYQKLWNVKKDDIAICKDCEFRYNCSDCRAFTQNTDDEHSKPLKCGYNPYTNQWTEWSINPLKTLVTEF